MYDALVIGSGYGGSVMAARLSERMRVMLVERGRRWRSGDFPRSLPRLAAARISRRNPLGLWGMRFGAGTGNALINGYGGASLVNYGITGRPEAHVFESWPLSAGDLLPHFERARLVLRPSPNPLAAKLADQGVLDRLAPGRRVDLENTIDWARCTQCGSCVPGCNDDAKLSLDRTYLPLAERNGTEIVTGTEVLWCRPHSEGGWELTLRRSDREQSAVVRARQVILAAGTFGSLDFLRRHQRVIPTTRMFGQRMSMNGDGLAFLYNTPLAQSGQDGAPISTSVRLPFVDSEGRARTLTVMAGRLPALAMRPAGRLLAIVAGLVQGERLGPHESFVSRGRRRLRDLFASRGDSGLERTLMYKLDAEDSARGTAAFDDDGHAAIDWPEYADEPILRFAAETLERWGEQIGGTVVRDLGRWPALRSMGVHPLGGCRMGATPDEGVVDSGCRLYRPAGGIYEGFYVVDASVIPTALGVPPSYTIAAVAERVAEQVA